MKKDRKNKLSDYDITILVLIIGPIMLAFIFGIIFTIHRIIYQDWDRGWNWIAGVTVFILIIIVLALIGIVLETLFPKSKVAKKISTFLKEILRYVDIQF